MNWHLVRRGRRLLRRRATPTGRSTTSGRSRSRSSSTSSGRPAARLAWVSRRGARRSALAAIAAASFAYAVHRVHASLPRPAYFSASARAWELALGAPAGRCCRAGAGPRGPRRRLVRAGRDRRRRPSRFGAGTAVPRRCRAAADARRGRADRRRACDAPAGASADAARRCGASAASPTRWYVWHWPVLVFAAAAWGRCRRGARVVAPAVAGARRSSPTAGSRSRSGARRCTCGGRASRSPPARGPAVGARCSGSPLSAERPVAAGAGRRRRGRGRGAARPHGGDPAARRRRCGRARATPTTTAAARSPTAAWSTPTRLRSPACVYGDRARRHDRRAVRRLARDAVVPGARARSRGGAAGGSSSSPRPAARRRRCSVVYAPLPRASTRVRRAGATRALRADRARAAGAGRRRRCRCSTGDRRRPPARPRREHARARRRLRADARAAARSRRPRRRPHRRRRARPGTSRAACRARCAAFDAARSHSVRGTPSPRRSCGQAHAPSAASSGIARPAVNATATRRADPAR